MAFPRKAFLMQPKLKRLLTYTPNFISLLCDSWLRFRFPTSPGAVSCDGLLPPPPCAESPFAHSRCYLLWRAVLRHVGRHYPPFFALTGSWARPPPSHFLPLSPGQWVFAGYRKPLLGDGPSRRYLRIPCIGAWTPTPPRPSGVSACFFPKSIGLTSRFTSSAREIIPAMQLQQGSIFRGCSHSVMFRLPCLLGPPVAPTAVGFAHRAAMAFTSPHISVCHLPEQGIC